jgi:hypothetical protein
MHDDGRIRIRTSDQRNRIRNIAFLDPNIIRAGNMGADLVPYLNLHLKLFSYPSLSLVPSTSFYIIFHDRKDGIWKEKNDCKKSCKK